MPLSNTGQTGGTPEADMKALKAWDITRGDNFGTHEPIGYGAYNDDFTLPVDDHGTHLSGILVADWDNKIGVADVSSWISIFPVAGASADELIVNRA